MVHNKNKVMIISLVYSVEKLYGFKQKCCCLIVIIIVTLSWAATRWSRQPWPDHVRSQQQMSVRRRAMPDQTHGLMTLTCSGNVAPVPVYLRTGSNSRLQTTTPVQQVTQSHTLGYYTHLYNISKTADVLTEAPQWKLINFSNFWYGICNSLTS